MRCRAVLLSCFLLGISSAQAQGPLLSPPAPPEEVAPGLPTEPEAQPQPQVQPEASALPQHPLTKALNQEMKDIAGAIRALDQSYYFRGNRSRKAWTAGSAFYDWNAQGLTPPANPRVLPPPPVNLSQCEPKVPPASPCPHCEPNQTPCPDCRNVPVPEEHPQQPCPDCGPAARRGCGELPIPVRMSSGCQTCRSNSLPSCESRGPAACPNCVTTVTYRGGRKCVQTFPCPNCQRN